MTTVAFMLPLADTWIGGQNYVFNLVSAYRSVRPDDKLVLIGASANPPAVFDTMLSTDSIEYFPTPVLKELRQPMRFLSMQVQGCFPEVRGLFKRLDVDRVFSPTFFLGRRSGVKIACWIPDFQHRHLPGLFSAKTRFMRNLLYGLCVRHSESVILSSFDAKRSFSELWPRHVNKVVVVPFVPTIELQTEECVRSVLAEYGIDRPFYFLPNQFWRHKDHQTAIDAIQLASREGWNGLLVCTGSAHDDRDLGYADALSKRLVKLEQVGLVRFLGSVPRRQVVALLQAAHTLINPSLFEGRSSTVEEAIALGVPMILSDLPVHKEQAEGAARYFRRADADSLKNCLLDDEVGRNIYVRTVLSSAQAGRSASFSRMLEEAMVARLCESST